jgi:ADP-heptose:LPS heptosyltransferase
MRNDKRHPKNYPYWTELVEKLTSEGHTLIQVGIEGEEQFVPDFRKNLSVADITTLLLECDTFIGVDSFGQHLGWSLSVKGIVIFGQSDPTIFGHPENINLLKDRKYLRDKQFWLWEQAEFIEDAFVSADEVISALHQHFD